MLQLKSKKSAVITAMNGEMQLTLKDKTINQGLTDGSIKSIGKGEKFIFAHADENVDRHYAIINDCAVAVSATVAGKTQEELGDILGDLTFFTGFSQEKYKDGKQDDAGEYVAWFRLGMPKGINLGEATIALEYDAEPATTTN